MDDSGEAPATLANQSGQLGKHTFFGIYMKPTVLSKEKTVISN